MSFQFCCPQGHVLQGDPSQIGQLFQCPMCGSSFLIPPPEIGPVSPGGFFQGAGNWPATNAPVSSYPPAGGMAGMMPPQNMPLMPGSPPPSGPMPVGPYPTPPGQPFAFGPMPVNPGDPQPTGPAPAAAGETPQKAPAATPQGAAATPRFDLGFDPHAQESLPFEIPGQKEAAAGEQGTGSIEQGAAPPFLVPSFAAPAMPAATFLPSASGQDFLQAAPAVPEEPPAPQEPPKVLHIRCPSGHLVKAGSDLLGKNGRCPACKKTFELRYEDSVEFQRRKEKILRREEIKTGKAWLAWAFLAAFLVFVGLACLILFLNH